MRAWLIRSGRSGEREQFAIDQGLAGGGFVEVPDLTSVQSRAELATLVKDSLPGEKPGKVANVTGQLWRLRGEVAAGDLVVLPMKTTSQIAIGVATSGYLYRADDPDIARRHVIPVAWKRVDLPRTAVSQDLLYTLGAFMTVCRVRRNNALDRLRALMETGKDPGSVGLAASPGVAAADDDDVDGVGRVDLEQASRDLITTHIGERFAGHGLAFLVAAVLGAEGFVTSAADPGPDGGVDVYAGRGPLGLDSPRVIVQVKSSPTPVDVKVVRELQGVLRAQGADQALLVAWGGVTKAARAELRSAFFSVRVWDSGDLVNAVIRTYQRLPDEMQATLPLKQIWTLVPEPDGD